MVGGSAWELNIDTNRFQEKKNNNFEYDIERINAKNNQILQDEGQQETFKTSVFTIIRVLQGLHGGRRETQTPRRAPACLDVSAFSYVNNTI